MMKWCKALVISLLSVLVFQANAGASASVAHSVSAGVAASVDFPEWEEAKMVLSLKNYNTRLVVLSTMLLGVASGLVGSFLLLRKRSLMGDALSHACLPGIVLMFIVMVLLGADGKSLSGLLLGASMAGVTGVGMVMLILRRLGFGRIVYVKCYYSRLCLER